MTIERKVGMGIAGQPSGGATDVEKVFSTYLYTGNSNVGSVVNDIDLSGKGGMVWIRARNYADNHVIMDTERGGTKSLRSNNINGEATASNLITSFNSDGFTRGNNGSISDAHNFVSWTFGKKRKFFDVVTYTGNGVAGRTIAHGLGGTVGMILVKRRDANSGWRVYHRGANGGTYPERYYAMLQATTAFGLAPTVWNNTAPTDSVFTVGTDTDTNVNNGTFVAYVFADNSSEDAEEQMIKCGSYVGNQNATGPVVNLGWEPQWLMVKQTNLVSDPADWIMVDSMRGWAIGAIDNSDARLYANATGAESRLDNIGIDITSTGFKLTTNGEQTNKNNATYIYMAIRAPMMVEPEAATDVFAMSTTSGGVIHNVGLVPDMAIWTNAPYSGQNRQIGSRLMGESYLRTNTTAPVSNANQGWDEKTGYWQNPNHGSSINLLWKRAKGYMDVVAYSGTSSARTQAHSLGVVPEMIWVKSRNASEQWGVYNIALGNTKYLQLHTTAAVSVANFWNNTSPTDSVFSLGSIDEVNGNNKTYIAFLFATLYGISKCGSYTGNGSYQTISCGFSAGSRFVLIKRTDASGDWFYWDSVRGIVAGNSPHLSLNSLAAQVNDDSIDPANSGFIVNQVAATNINVSSGTYIFYAIA